MILVNLLRSDARCTGRCCRRLAIPGRKQCAKHFRIGRANQVYSQVRRSKRAALGHCRSCDQPSVENSIFCELHREESRASVKRFRSTEKGAETNRLVNLSEHIERKLQKRCTACGKNPAQEDNLKCSRCVDADARNSVERKVKRLAAGLCIYCNEPVRIGVGRLRSSCDACRKIHKGYDGTLSSRFSRARSMRREKYGWTLHFDDYVKIVTQPCAYCRLDNTTDQGCGLDRLDNSRGYHLDNVVSCCPECNMVRNNIFTVEEMKILGEAVRQIKLARMAKKDGGG